MADECALAERPHDDHAHAVVRRRRQEIFGHGEHVALLKTCAGLPPDAVADRVEAAVIAASEGRWRDDMAILAFGPTPQPKETDG